MADKIQAVEIGKIRIRLVNPHHPLEAPAQLQQILPREGIAGGRIRIGQNQQLGAVGALQDLFNPEAKIVIQLEGELAGALQIRQYRIKRI